MVATTIRAFMRNLSQEDRPCPRTGQPVRVPFGVHGGLGATLLARLVFNLTQLPYTMLFKVVMFVSFPIACLLGIKFGKRPQRAA